MELKTLGFIHTALVMVDVIKKELGTLPFEVNPFHIVDESLLIELMKTGELNPKIVRRLCQHVVAAEESGAEIITVTCSSISPSVDIAKRLVSCTVLKIDEPMAEVAVDRGKKIGILASVATTLGPTSALLRQKAKEAGKEISFSTALCQEAFQAILQGDIERHDRMVTEKGMELSRVVDLIVLAQGSMARLALPLSQKISIPVLSSPPLFFGMLRSMLRPSERQ